MKKLALAAAAAFLMPVLWGAPPLYEHFPNIHVAAKEALRSGALKDGDTAFPAVINGKRYPGTWSFWVVKSGNSFEDIELAPMQFRRAGVSKGQFVSPAGHSFSDLNFGFLRNRGGECGMGFSFRNPSQGALDLELDGSLRLYAYDPAKPYQLFIYTVNADGTKKLISSSANKDAIWSVQYPKGELYYFRLASDVRLEKGAVLFVVLLDKHIREFPANKIKYVFCLNEGRRNRAFVPCFILRSPIKK